MEQVFAEREAADKKKAEIEAAAHAAEQAATHVDKAAALEKAAVAHAALEAARAAADERAEKAEARLRAVEAGAASGSTTPTSPTTDGAAGRRRAAIGRDKGAEWPCATLCFSSLHQPEGTWGEGDNGCLGHAKVGGRGQRAAARVASVLASRPGPAAVVAPAARQTT